MELIIVRHGATKWNKINKIQGCSDIPLSNEGINQGYLLANRLKKIDIDFVFSSDLSRAADTAKIICNIINLPFVQDSRLREMNFGNWEGLSLKQIINSDKLKFDQWRNHPSLVKFENGESIYDVKERALDFFNDIYSKYEDSNVLLVSHGTFIKVLIIALLDADMDLYKNLKQDNTAVNIIKLVNKRPVLKLFNDTCHI
jgi:probable phosphoglycerate mutase